ncbi:hypothetical protein BDV19DRAFT_385353 [Aspergillus venezuelensis]
MEALLESRPRLRTTSDYGKGFTRPEQELDTLFKAEYRHVKDSVRGAKANKMSTNTSLRNASVSPYPNDTYTVALIVSSTAEYSFAIALLDELYTIPQTRTLTQPQATLQ